MKRLLTIVLLTAAICSAADYSRFAQTGPALVNGERIMATYYTAWVESPVAFLNEPIPEAAQVYFYGQRTDEEGNPIAHDPLILKDFILGTPAYSLDGTKCIITIAARNGLMYRTMFVTEQDMAVWEQYLTAYGFDSSKWLTTDEFFDLLNSPAYSAGDDL